MTNKVDGCRTRHTKKLENVRTRATAGGVGARDDRGLWCTSFWLKRFLNDVSPFILALLNPFTTENPFLGTKLLEFNIGRGSGALKGLKGVLNS